MLAVAKRATVGDAMACDQRQLRIHSRRRRRLVRAEEFGVRLCTACPRFKLPHPLRVLP